MMTPHEADVAADLERREQSTDELMVQRFIQIELRQAKSAERMQRIEGKLDANTKATAENADATAEVLDILRMGKSFFRLAGWIGSLLKWIAAVGGGFLAAYIAWRGNK